MSNDSIERIKDPKFYLENFVKIKGKTPGLIPFILNEAQKDLFNTLNVSTRVIILKARQLGFSTAVTGYFYHKTIMVPGTNTALIGYNSDLTSELLDKVKTFYATTPGELKPTIQYNSKYEISFPKINSKIIVLPSTENVGRGYTLHNVLATELSSWEKADEKMMTLEASVPITGQIVIESCVTGDTFVITSEGPRRVKDVHNWEDFPLGFSDGKEILIDGHYGMKPTSTYYNSGIQKGFRIKTSHGIELGMSSIHKIYRLENGILNFTEARDLKIGDIIPVKYGQEQWGHQDDIKWKPIPYGFNKKHINLFSPYKVEKDLAYLIGLILGDGYVDFKQGRVVVTTTDIEISEFLENNSLGLRFTQSKGKDKYHYICKNQSFVEFLSKYLGWSQKKAKYKEIPKIVFGWSRENVSSFLQGLFDTDGSCRKDRGTVTLASSSKEIIDGTRILLLNFGIISHTYEHDTPPTQKARCWSHGYSIEISRGHSFIFGEKIGFRIKRKQNNIRQIKPQYSSLQETIPGIGSVIKEEIKNLGVSFKKSGISNKSLWSNSGNITYSTLDKILSNSKNKKTKAFDMLSNLKDKHYLYTKILEINEIEEPVYDFTVDDGHTVSYNGIVGHQTPKGQGNTYHKMVMSDNDYVKKEYGWWWMYTEEEIDVIRRRMNDPLKFAQEYELTFLSSGRMVFDSEVIDQMRSKQLFVGDIFKNTDGTEGMVTLESGLRIYKQPELGHTYVVGSDIAEGVTGGDYSVAVIFDRTTGEEVAFYRGLMAPDKFAAKLDEWGRKYNNALMVVEINNHGLTTITVLKQLMYPCLYFRPAKFEVMGSPYSEKMGWKTTKMTRPLLIDDLGQAIRDGDLIMHSKEILDEMTTFVYDKNNDMGASDGFHDDTIISVGIAYQGFKILYDKPLVQLRESDSDHVNAGY